MKYSRKLSGKNAGLIGLLFGASSLTGCASFELNLPQKSFYNEEKPFLLAGVDGFMDSLLENDLHSLGYEINKNCNIAVVVNSVDLEEKNIQKILEAHNKGSDIALAGYSMGAGRVYQLIKKFTGENNYPRVQFKLVLFYDPTFTNDGPIYLPSNVDRVVAFFSTNPSDPLAWTRGKPENIKGHDRLKIEIKHKEGANHLDLMSFRYVGEDTKKAIEQIRK